MINFSYKVFFEYKNFQKKKYVKKHTHVKEALISFLFFIFPL